MKPLVQFLSNKIGFQNYGTLETTQLVVSYALRYRQKPSRKAQRKCGKHDAVKTRAMHFIREFFGGKRLLEPPVSNVSTRLFATKHI